MDIERHQINDPHHCSSISMFDLHHHTADADFRDRIDQLFEEEIVGTSGPDDDEMEICLTGPTHTDRHALYPEEIWESIEAADAYAEIETKKAYGVVVGTTDTSTGFFSSSFEPQTSTKYRASLQYRPDLGETSGCYQQPFHELTAEIEYLPESPKYYETPYRDSPAYIAQSPPLRTISGSPEYLPISPRFEAASLTFSRSRSLSSPYRGLSESSTHMPATPEYLPISPKYAQISLSLLQHRDSAGSPSFMPESPNYARAFPCSTSPPPTQKADTVDQYIPPLDQWYGRVQWLQQVERQSEGWLRLSYVETEIGRIEREGNLDVLDVADEALASAKWCLPETSGLKDSKSAI